MNSHFPLKMTIVSPASFEKPNGKANSSFQVIQHHQDTIQRERATYQRHMTFPYYYNTLTVENRYMSLLSLINVTYPPHICSLCDKTFRSASETDYHCKISHKCRRFLCLHPHCDRRFSSRTALHFHMTRSHLIHQAPPQYTIQEPPFMQYNVEPNIGRFSTYTPPSPPLPSHSSNQHVTTTTTVYNPASCSCCDHPTFCFSQKMNGKQHVTKVHQDQQGPYQGAYPNCTSNKPSHPTTKDSLLYHNHDNSNAAPESHPNQSQSSCIPTSVPQ